MDWVANLPPGYVYVLYVFLGRNGTLPELPLEVQGNILLRWRNHERAEFNYNKAIIFFREHLQYVILPWKLFTPGTISFIIS